MCPSTAHARTLHIHHEAHAATRVGARVGLLEADIENVHEEVLKVCLRGEGQARVADDDEGLAAVAVGLD